VQRYREGDSFLQRIVTCRQAALPRTKKFKSVPSADKVMLTLFWNINGPILEHHQDRGLTVSSARYCTVLAIRSKRIGMPTNGVVLHYDNARPHTAAATVETIRKLKFELLRHPAYSRSI
jgi:hypothetical protein